MAVPPRPVPPPPHPPQPQKARGKPSAPPPPPWRKLRIYAFDPSLDLQMETATINQVVANVRWEEDLQPGPTGEYVEVVDVDPSSGVCYEPVDLNNHHLLAMDGCSPSEGNPKFHQQMVYAVAMTTIQNFELALGRKALWYGRNTSTPRKPRRAEYVQRLRIYPHALREANAFYDRDRKALLFGYFPASRINPGNNLPGGTVFSCLSFDIVAHETTHALLDGLHHRYAEGTNPDVFAFHEAFADIVALLQRFTFPEVLNHEIASTRGAMRHQTLLAKLAWQFGQAIGHYGALRDALGTVDEKGEWQPSKPDPNLYQTAMEPHERGSVLVAAVFDAFVTIYEKRTADLIRIATGGSGVLSEGALHPDLVNRLAEEAAIAARQVLNICIRALDYCPPVDITFGDYLRAMITIDCELVASDTRGYRIAIIEAFRRRGIYPSGVRTLSVDSLQWRASDNPVVQRGLRDALNYLETAWMRPGNMLLKSKEFDNVHYLDDDKKNLDHPDVAMVTEDREFIFNLMVHSQRYLHGEIERLLDDTDEGRELAGLLGLIRGRRFEVSPARPARRILPTGEIKTEFLVRIVQTVEVERKSKTVMPERTRDAVSKGLPDGCFLFRGGCTLVIDMDKRDIKFLITKSVCDQARIDRQCDYTSETESSALAAMYGLADTTTRSPFAAMHRGLR